METLASAVSVYNIRYDSYHILWENIFYPIWAVPRVPRVAVYTTRYSAPAFISRRSTMNFHFSEYRGNCVQ